MRIVDYGLENFSSDKESEEIVAKTKHFVESANKLSAIVYKTLFCPHGYFRYVAIVNNLELEIVLKIDRDLQSIELLQSLNPVKVNKVYSEIQTYKRTFSITEKLNRENHTIQCGNCSKMTIFFGGVIQFCSHCGEKIADEKVKFCPKCQDDCIYGSEYIFCPRCGEDLLGHPDEDMSPLNFETEDLLAGVYMKSEYMDYKKIIPQAQSNKNQVA